VRAPEPGIQRAFDTAVAALDATVVAVPFESPERMYPAYAAIQNAEAALAHADRFPARRDEYGEDVAARLDFALSVTLADYVEATTARECIRAGFASIFAAADVLLTPVSGVPPEPIEQPTHQEFRDGVLPYTVPQDLAGLPACAVPVGFDDLGLPVGVQITGPAGSEGLVLAAAEALFSATASARAGFVLAAKSP
jgi:Asp-tRNA(Asn)/Glu-tRNA(Gln) amidotransferase A subunit family amidase